MTTVLATSSLAGVAFLATAVKASRFSGERTVLLVANEAQTPEIVVAPWEAPGFAALAAAFDEVIWFNELIAPLHPVAWRPPAAEIPLLARLLRTRVAPDHDIAELVVESVLAGSGRALVELIPDVPITVATHGLELYAPVVSDASSEIGGRVTRLLHVDLVPGVGPLLRYHPAITAEAIPLADFRETLAALDTGDAITADAVLVGDRYAEREVLTVDAELALHVNTIRALAAGGRKNTLFVPHPAAAPINPHPLLEAARAAGVALTMAAPGTSPEVVAARTDALVVGTQSPALFVATHAATSGCRDLLALKTRYASSDRMPLTIADAGLPSLDPKGKITQPSTDVALLVDAVAFSMAPKVVPELRDRTAEWLARHGLAPYLRRSILGPLGLVTDLSGSRRLAARARTWVRSRSGPTGAGS